MNAFRMYAIQSIDSQEINKNMLWVGYFLCIFLVNRKTKQWYLSLLNKKVVAT